MMPNLAICLLCALFQVAQFSGDSHENWIDNGQFFNFSASKLKQLEDYFTLQRKCGLNAFYQEGCSRSANWCTPRCDLLFPDLCTASCAPGCDCLPGFVFKEGQSGDCIRREECPKMGKKHSKCGANAVYRKCSDSGSRCSSNCLVTRTLLCYIGCFPGCDCRNGFVFKEGMAGDCIRPEECPPRQPVTMTPKSTKENPSF